MKVLARMIAFLSFLGMVQYANAQNSVYVEQIGSGSTISLTQTGVSNQIGNSTTKAVVNGNNNTITMDQIGNTNVAALNVQGDGATITSNVIGNSNSVDIGCGATGGSCSSSIITQTITGDGNIVNQNTEGTAISTVTINSNNNTVNINNTSTAVAGTKSSVDISGGGGNTVDILQAGAAGTGGHDADLTIVGATNTVDIRQGGSVDSKVVSSITGSGNNLTIKSNHP